MSTNLVIFTLIISSSIMCIITNSWIILWIFLEMNTLSFCSWTTHNIYPPNTSSAMNYFIIQSIASAILITSTTLINDTSNINSTPQLIATIALILNLASAPLHQWFINLSNSIQWKNNIALFTWQNLAPSFLVLFQNNQITTPFILSSAILGSVLIINNNSINEIIALSSIFNTSWILLCISINTNILITYSAIYWTSVMFIIVPIESSNISSKTDINNLNTSNIFSLILAVNLAGFPPLIGFIAKWIPLTNTTNIEINLLSTLILMLSALNAFTYMRAISTPTINTPNENQNNEDTPINTLQNTFTIINSLIFLTLTI